MKKTMGLMALLIGTLAATGTVAIARDRDDWGYRGNDREYSYAREGRDVRRDNDRWERNTAYNAYGTVNNYKGSWNGYTVGNGYSRGNGRSSGNGYSRYRNTDNRDNR